MRGLLYDKVKQLANGSGTLEYGGLLPPRRERAGPRGDREFYGSRMQSGLARLMYHRSRSVRVRCRFELAANGVTACVWKRSWTEPVAGDLVFETHDDRSYRYHTQTEDQRAHNNARGFQSRQR